MISQRGELFSFLLPLYPLESGQIVHASDKHIQAVFLDIVCQIDPTLYDWLRAPNQRCSYTVGLLQGNNYLAPTQLEEARMHRQMLCVQPGQAYWLRITMLDATIFSPLAQYLIAMTHALTVRIGEAQFEISQLLMTPESDVAAQSLMAYSSFADLYVLCPAQRQYHFEFMSPTTFSRGRQIREKSFQIFPEPVYVFEYLAQQWEFFAPAQLRMAASGTSLRAFSLWCEENIVAACYSTEEIYLPLSRPGQSEFQGTVTYEVKGLLTSSEARWLSPLARFAFFSGVGYKTAVGMGRTRCTNLLEPSLFIVNEYVQ